MDRADIMELEQRRIRRLLTDMSTKDIRTFFSEQSPAVLESLWKEMLNDPLFGSDLLAATAKRWLEGRAEDEHAEHKNYGIEAGAHHETN